MFPFLFETAVSMTMECIRLGGKCLECLSIEATESENHKFMLRSSLRDLPIVVVNLTTCRLSFSYFKSIKRYGEKKPFGEQWGCAQLSTQPLDRLPNEFLTAKT